MIDRLRQMAIFAKTIDHGSFRGAARELRLSPSVISHHISQLEEHLGVALIYRSTRKLALTQEGERLLAATHKMLEAVEGELSDLSGSADEPSGELRLTVPSVLSQSNVMDRIAAFGAAYPRIRLSLDFSDIRRDLIEDGYDFAIRLGSNSKNSATARKLFDVKRILVASSDYSASQLVPRDPNDLENWAWLALTPAQKGVLNFRKRGDQNMTIKPNARISTNDAQALYRLARAGSGLAIVPEFLTTEDITKGIVKHVLPEWEVPSIHAYAVWPANAPKHGLIHLALNALSKHPPAEDMPLMKEVV